MRNEDHFNLWWENLVKRGDDVGIDQPTLPRKRRPPLSLDSGSAAVHPFTPKDHYRAVYFEAIDTVVGCIQDSFEQEGYRVYSKLENILINGDQGTDSDEVFYLYQEDIDRGLFNLQLSTLHANYNIKKDAVLLDIVDIVKRMSAAEKSLLSEIVKSVRIFLVVPATNCASERSFSSMRRVKTYLRSTMLQKRLNALMILHVHKHYTDNLDLKDIARDFIDKCDYRKNKFPKF